MNTLVTTDWLSRHLDDPDLIVLDCSVRTAFDEQGGAHNFSGRSDYEAGHVPTAGFADLTGELSDPSSPIEFALPSPERFCAVMGDLGVGDDTRVVLYDSWMGWAARVWWMLRWVGFDRAALLDGGLRAWSAEGRALSTDPVVRLPRLLIPDVRPELIADRDEVVAAMDDPSVCLVDAMPEEHFRGEFTMYARPGHIPGASNVSVMDLFDETGHFRPLDDLAGRFDPDPHARTITYCGGGIAASATAFVLTRLGFEDVAVYTASLQEWAADPVNPLVLGVG